MKIRIAEESELELAATEFLAHIGTSRHVSLRGEMGAGKTTFVSALGRVLGVEDDVTSPTFSIINEYRTASGRPLFHFDFYRIEEPAQAFELGLDDYFESDALCLMEWADNVEGFLPDDLVEVEITVLEDGTREMTIPD